jgi:hypothetical protein
MCPKETDLLNGMGFGKAETACRTTVRLSKSFEQQRSCKSWTTELLLSKPDRNRAGKSQVSSTLPVTLSVLLTPILTNYKEISLRVLSLENRPDQHAVYLSRSRYFTFVPVHYYRS